MSDENFIPWDYPVDAQSYVKNLLVDPDEGDDVRLHTAALCGDAQSIEAILKEENSLQWIDYKVRPFVAPPLRLAVTGGNIECVRLLLAAGADLELEDIKGQSPLFVASSLENVAIMKLLLEYGANPEGSLKNRGTPLLNAVRDGFSEGVQLLLEHGANPEPFEQLVSCVPGWPLHHAVVYSHFPVFMALLRSGARTTIDDVLNKATPSLTGRLSIPHAIVKYAKDRPEFAKLYHACGGNLLQPDQKGDSILKNGYDIYRGSKSYESILQLISEPMSLKSISRLRIRRQLGKSRLQRIDNLEVPATLQTFLNYGDFTCYVSKSIWESNGLYQS